MRVLQINKFYSPTIGGVETVAKDYSDYFSQAGHQVSILCVQKDFGWRTKVEHLDGATVYRCSSLGTFFSMPLSVAFFFYYVRLLREHDVLVFHLPFPLSTLLSVLTLKKRVIVVWHSDILKQKRLKLLFEPFTCLLLHKSSKVVATSPQLVEFSTSLPKFRGKCQVIPLAVDVADLLCKPYAGATAIAAPESDFLFLGRLAYYKGISFLLDAVKQLADEGIKPQVVIAGSGALAGEVLQFLQRNRLDHVLFINRFVSEEEKYSLLRKTKCFLFPSVANTEAFGITQLEAMTFSVPIINTHLRTAVSWVSVHGVSGITVQPESAVELAAAMKAIVADPRLAEEYGKNGLARVSEMFDKSQVNKSVVDLLAE